jgi:hypothetical protein
VRKALTLAIVVCSLLSGGTPARTPPKKAGGNITAADDRRIEETIKAKLAKSKIGADHFTVHVQGGIATWEGRTSVIQHKGAATRMAKSAGASAVVNKIQIDEAARRKARENLQSGPRHAELKRSELRDHR